MNKKKKILLTIIGIIGLLLITVGVSYSIFNYIKEGTTQNSIEVGNITFLYTEVSGVGKGIKIENASPTSDIVGKNQLGEGKIFDFKIISNTINGVEIPYEITARKTGDLDESVVKTYLTKISGVEEQEVLLDRYSNLTQTERVDSAKYVEKTLYKGVVPKNTKNYEQNFRLRMWIAEDTDFSPIKGENGEDVYPYNNKTFSLTVNVYANGKELIEEMENTNISRVSVNNQTLTKTVEKDYDYEIVVPGGTTHTVIDVETENPNATVAIERINTVAYQEINKVKRLSTSKDVTLNHGDNDYKIIVTSENKRKRAEYKIRISVKSNDATLRELNVTGYNLSPTFNSSNTLYRLNIPDTVTNLTINPVVNDERSSYKIEGNTDLAAGENIITITVTAEDGTTKTYTLTVNLIQIKIYGIKRSLTTSSSAWERTNDAIGLEANRQVGTTSVRNDFDSIYPWSDIISYNYDTGTKQVTATYGESGFTFKPTGNIEVLTKIPEFYYKREQKDGYEYIYISNGQQEGYIRSEEFSVGRYTMSGDTTRVHSRSGASPLSGIDLTHLRTYANNLGSEFGLLDYHYFILQLLYLVEYADYNSQAKLGAGVSGSSRPATSGQCDVLGMKSGTGIGISSIIYRGIENIYGNMNQYIDGILIQNYQTYICYDKSRYASTLNSCYQRVGYVNAKTSDVYISKLGYDSNHPLVAFPTETNGRNSTYITDAYESASGINIATVGGTYNDSGVNDIGMWNWILRFTTDSGHSTRSSRLLKID